MYRCMFFPGTFSCINEEHLFRLSGTSAARPVMSVEFVSLFRGKKKGGEKGERASFEGAEQCSSAE